MSFNSLPVLGTSIVEMLDRIERENLARQEAKEAEQAAWDAMSDEEKVFHKLKTPPKPVIEDYRVILLMIRRIVPNLIAEEICGVQPMTIPDGTICTIKPDYENKKPTE